MARIDWSKAVDLARAVTNVRSEFPGDWHRDPWGWPELEYVVRTEPQLVVDRLASTGARQSALLDVPKENWGTRPAVVLDVLDRVAYQALVDQVSVSLIGDMSPNTFGWRLPAVDPKKGEYSHNGRQWEGYRDHLATLAGWNTVALKMDITSCFASIPIATAQERIESKCPSNAVTKRLCDLLDGFGNTPERSGLPQRSLASAVIANMILMPLDDVLEGYSGPLMRLFASKVEYRTFARWMDDIWLFGTDPARARRAQMDLQSEAQSMGLTLNTAKTQLLEGDDVVASALEIEHSAIDAGIADDDFKPLEALVDELLDQREQASRTSLKFVLGRMVEHDSRYRVQALLQTAERLPHGADGLADLFKVAFVQAGLQDWFLEYARSDWATHQWTVAQYAGMFPSGHKPKKALRDFYSESVRDANTSLPLLAVCAQRLAAWARRGAHHVPRRGQTCHKPTCAPGARSGRPVSSGDTGQGPVMASGR